MPTMHDEIEEEIEGIESHIERLQAEIAALRRLQRRFASRSTDVEDAPAEPTKGKRLLTDLVIEYVIGCGEGGAKTAGVVTYVQRKSEYKPNSIKATLYRLRSDGYLNQDGDTWTKAEGE
jgi:hypothetical protein